MASTTRTSASKSRNSSNTPSSEELHEQIEQLRADIATLSKSVSTMGTAKADEFRNRASEVPADIADAYEGAMHSLRKEYDALERQLARNVRQNPLQSLGIAAGVGVLAALLLRR